MTDANPPAPYRRSPQDRALGDPNIVVECEGNHYITVLEFHCQHIYIYIYISTKSRIYTCITHLFPCKFFYGVLQQRTLHHIPEVCTFDVLLYKVSII